MSDSKTKKHRQMDMQAELLTHAFKWKDIVRKSHNDVNVIENVNMFEGIDQLDNNEEESRDRLP